MEEQELSPEEKRLLETLDPDDGKRLSWFGIQKEKFQCWLYRRLQVGLCCRCYHGRWWHIIGFGFHRYQPMSREAVERIRAQLINLKDGDVLWMGEDPPEDLHKWEAEFEDS